MPAITEKFEQLKLRGEKAFVPFIMAGDPDLDTTVRLVPELDRAGSAVIELGVPFSDPVADGPVIQRAGARSLAHGYTLSDYLQAVREIRRESSVPLLLFSYYNPLLQYGLEELAQDARSAGIDGVLATDITPEEGEEYCRCMHGRELDTVFLVAPTTPAERVAKIAACSSGFVYVVSRAGVTGIQAEVSVSLRSTVGRVRSQTELPVVVGFGISRPEHVRMVWEIADGAVVGSAIVAQIEREQQTGSAQLPRQIGEFCRWLVKG
jgi:tryptophan synthase alpha chain